MTAAVDAPRALAAVLLLALVAGGCAHRQSVRRAAPVPATGAASKAIRADPATVSLVDRLYAYYRQWRGVPYRYGGTDTDGVDCSSFVRQTVESVEARALPRTTRAQAQHGRRIARDQLSPGDLVFFKTGRSGRHVGVYVGSGRFMHVSASVGVTLSRLDNVYWRQHYWQARRLEAPAR